MSCSYIVKFNIFAFTDQIYTRSICFYVLLIAYVFIESIDCILLSSFELRARLLKLIFSVKSLCLSLLSLCCVFNINLLCLMISLLFYYYICQIYLFLDISFYYQVDFPINSFYHFQIQVVIYNTLFCDFCFFIFIIAVLKNYMFLLLIQQVFHDFFTLFIFL